MDLIGDSYVVMGLCDNDEDLNHVCAKMVSLAKEMTVAVKESRVSISGEVCMPSVPCMPTIM